MFEHHSKHLLDRQHFYKRLVKYSFIASLIIVFSLIIGILGYRYFEGLSWLDALLNSSMILTGMGPVSELHNDSAKLFASFYALFSGIIFLSAVSVLAAPLLHRFLHKFHLEMEEAQSKKSKEK